MERFLAEMKSAAVEAGVPLQDLGIEDFDIPALRECG